MNDITDDRRKLWPMWRACLIGLLVVCASLAVLKLTGSLPEGYTWPAIIVLPGVLILTMPAGCVFCLRRNHWVWHWVLAVGYVGLLLFCQWLLSK